MGKINTKLRFTALCGAALALILPLAASAHEVYVLTPGEIAQALATPSPNPFSAIPGALGTFLSWGAGVALLILAVALLGRFLSRRERVVRIFANLKAWAPLASRLTLGSALLASGWFSAIFGPELPLSGFSSTLAVTLRAALFVAGFMVLIGYRSRIGAVIGLCIFGVAVAAFHAYMFTYANYFGEMLVILILGSGSGSIDRLLGRGGKGTFFAAMEKYSFPILRVLFGISLFYASFYAKFLHSNLALDTVNRYHLTNFFAFAPLFVVLGAFLVETTIAAFFFFGIEVRFTALVFTAFLTASILFFGEAVWPHIILFGVTIALFLHGYDDWTLGSAIAGRRGGDTII